MRDIQLSEIEKVLLERSTEIDVHRRRILRTLLLSVGLVVLLVTVKVSDSDKTEAILFWAFLVYVLLNTYEKMSHHLLVVAYKRLIQKLATTLARARGLGSEGAGESSDEPPPEKASDENTEEKEG